LSCITFSLFLNTSRRLGVPNFFPGTQHQWKMEMPSNIDVCAVYVQASLSLRRYSVQCALCSVCAGEPVFATVHCAVYVQASLSLRRHSTPGIIPLAGEARPNERAERFKQCETANDQLSVNQADNILKALRPEMARSNHNSSMTVSMFVCCG